MYSQGIFLISLEPGSVRIIALIFFLWVWHAENLQMSESLKLFKRLNALELVQCCECTAFHIVPFPDGDTNLL